MFTRHCRSYTLSNYSYIQYLLLAPSLVRNGWAPGFVLSIVPKWSKYVLDGEVSFIWRSCLRRLEPEAVVELNAAELTKTCGCGFMLNFTTKERPHPLKGGGGG